MRLRLVPPLRPAEPRLAEAVRVPFAAVRPRLAVAVFRLPAALVVRLLAVLVARLLAALVERLLAALLAPLLRDAVLAVLRFGAALAVLRLEVLRAPLAALPREAVADLPREAEADLARVPVAALAREVVALPRLAEADLARVPVEVLRPAEAVFRVPFAAVARLVVFRAVLPDEADLLRLPALARPPFAAAAVRPAAPRALLPGLRVPDDAARVRFAAPSAALRVDLARLPAALRVDRARVPVVLRLAGLRRFGFSCGCSVAMPSASAGGGVCSISSLMLRSS